MNSRERNLILVFAVIIVGGVSIYAGNRWFLRPLKDYNAQIKTLSDENDTFDLQLQVFARDRKRLELARVKSLPANTQVSSLEYGQFLKSEVAASGLTLDDFTPMPPQKVKLVAPIPGVPAVKETGHQLMTFNFKAKGELKQIVKFMEKMQTTPYEHRIKTLSIHRVDQQPGKKDASNALVVTMSVETFVVAKTQTKPGTGPSTDSTVLASLPIPDNRQYAMIAERNIFVGLEPITKMVPGETVTKFVYDNADKTDDPPVKFKRDIDLPRYVRMTQTVPDEQTVYLKNRAYKSDEIKLIAQKKGSDTFRFKDEAGKYEFCNIKVLQVNLREVFFQVKDQAYVLHFGKSLHDAMQKSLDPEDLILIGVEMDEEWGALEKSKSKTPSKTKGPTKGGPR